MGDIDLVGIGRTSQRSRLRLIEQLRADGIKNQAVLDVLCSTPRHLFVDAAFAEHAYENRALPIGYKQTISQPYIVARMTELLLGKGTQGVPERVLEVGTGCGYQTAVLAQLVKEVYTVERIQALLEQAKKRFRKLNLYNIKTKFSDGHCGWASQSPFDAILVTAAPEKVPESLLEQLKDNASLVIPVGNALHQSLCVYTRHGDRIESRTYEAVSFVPLVEGQV